MRLTLIWVFTMSAFALLAVAVGLVLYTGWTHDLWLETIRNNFAALVLMPISCGFAMVLVLVLRITAGEVEFKVLGLEFRGASGQLVFWVLVFLAQIVAVKALWHDPPAAAPVIHEAPRGR